MLRLGLLLLIISALLPVLPGRAAPGGAQPAVREFVLGSSAQGRPIEVVQFGGGPRKLVVVGDTHGGPEANTHQLTLQLIDHFRANPGLVPPTVRLYFIPTLNPDGLALGWRFDAAGVDLNRNMNTNLDACPENDWSTTVQGAYGFVSETGGPYADSQVESRLIRSFLWDASGAIFIHSNAGLVFPAACEHAPSIAMAEAYAAAASYTYSRFWPNYNITGGMHDWAGSLGIAAITPELITGDLPEFAQNLAGLQAVLAQAERVMPLPEEGLAGGFAVPAPIYRYWRALGGAERFGLPLEVARSGPDGVTQTFARARIGLRHELADTPFYVQAEGLGASAAQSLAYGGAGAIVPVGETGVGRSFPETGHTLKEAFLDFWERGGGADVYGLPLSEEFETTAADGERRIVQYLERAVVAYYPEDGGVRLEPLGERELVLEGLGGAGAQQMVR
jgi:hypothetical protein